jgi:hypothetical protein
VEVTSCLTMSSMLLPPGLVDRASPVFSTTSSETLVKRWMTSSKRVSFWKISSLPELTSSSATRQLSRSAPRWSIGPPKTSDSLRSFSLDTGTVAVLKQHRRAQREEQLRAGPAWEGQEWGLAFCNEDGTPLRPYTPLFELKRLARAAGVPVLVLHELRHTAATVMLAKGISPKVVSERMGHATVGITLDLYGHGLLEQDQDAAERIGSILGTLG